MKMIPIFLGVTLAALLAAAYAALEGASISTLRESGGESVARAAVERHQLIGLFAAVLLLVSQCVVFVYFLGTGKAVKTAVETRNLDPELAARTRKLKGKTFPFATFSALGVVAGAVLSGSAAPSTHATVMFCALGLFLVAIPFEMRSILENTKLMDLTGSALEHAEEKIVEDGGTLADPDVAPPAFILGRLLLVIGASIWLVFAYRALVMRADPQPWPWYIIICALSLLFGVPLWFAGRRRPAM